MIPRNLIEKAAILESRYVSLADSRTASSTDILAAKRDADRAQQDIRDWVQKNISE
jgi:outer membrane murein-binding lipoprotein Lpp